MNKRFVDWEAIEPHYRSGIRSLKDIGAEYGVSDAAIVKHAKKNGWVRDLGARVLAKQQAMPVAVVADEMARAGYVYVIYIETSDGRFYKVGMAVNPMERFKSHQTSSPFEVKVATAYMVENMRLEEGILHEAFAEKRVRGEWYVLDASDLALIAARTVRA